MFLKNMSEGSRCILVRLPAPEVSELMSGCRPAVHICTWLRYIDDEFGEIPQSDVWLNDDLESIKSLEIEGQLCRHWWHKRLTLTNQPTSPWWLLEAWCQLGTRDYCFTCIILCHIDCHTNHNSHDPDFVTDLNSMRPSDTYMYRLSNHHWFR